MRIWTALALFCALGCGGSNSSPSLDLGSSDLARAQPALDAGTDGGGSDAGGGKQPFGGACSVDADCATGSCFVGSAMSFCTMPCTAATQATDCPNPPTSGTCNMRGFCKP
jgi:hypothetical protein